MPVFRFIENAKIPMLVRIWLITGLVMIFIQIVIGGVTRLTGSGLSITRWEVVQGTLPPLSAAEWQETFDLYKATPQYQKVNKGMSMQEFKFIYFWEYFHRLWARLMFFVFVIPFFWFLSRGMLSREIVPKLLGVVLLAGLEGFFGWIMVYSGLIERPWVNAYNLTLHLTMALIIYSYLMWITLGTFYPNKQFIHKASMKRLSWGILVLVFIQIALGAMMSGTKSGLFYPEWPTMKGGFLPDVLLDRTQWHLASFIEYDTNPFMPALLQFLHRNTAYLLTIITLYFSWKLFKQTIPVGLRKGLYVLITALLLQVILGILTLVNCVGQIPVTLGVLHQAGAVVLLSIVLFVSFRLRFK